MTDLSDSLVRPAQVSERVKYDKLVSSNYIIFCKKCKYAFEHASHKKTLPVKAKCPKCRSKGRVRFKRDWGGDYSRLPALTIASPRSRAGAAFLKIMADAELRAQGGDA
jgi:uncharacterized paraquat-inducible protein A